MNRHAVIIAPRIYLPCHSFFGEKDAARAHERELFGFPLSRHRLDLLKDIVAKNRAHCERYAAQNDGRESEKARQKRYAKCMSARDYQWVVKEKPVSLPEQSGQLTHPPSCPAGSNCTPGGTKDGGLKPEVNQSITQEGNSLQNTANVSPDPSHQSNEVGGRPKPHHTNFR